MLFLENGTDSFTQSVFVSDSCLYSRFFLCIFFMQFRRAFTATVSVLMSVLVSLVVHPVSVAMVGLDTHILVALHHFWQMELTAVGGVRAFGRQLRIVHNDISRRFVGIGLATKRHRMLQLRMFLPQRLALVFAVQMMTHVVLVNKHSSGELTLVVDIQTGAQ